MATTDRLSAGCLMLVLCACSSAANGPLAGEADAEAVAALRPGAAAATEAAAPYVPDTAAQAGGQDDAEPVVAAERYRVVLAFDVAARLPPSDPQGERGAALTALIEATRSDPRVAMAIVTFGAEATYAVPTFSQNTAELLAAVPKLQQPLPASNYPDALTWVTSLVGRDAVALTPAQRQQTAYIIYWIADGPPEAPAGSPGDLAARCRWSAPLVMTLVDHLVNMADTLQVLDLRLHTVLLAGAAPYTSPCGMQFGSPQQFWQGEPLLQRMASAGRGTFSKMTPQQLAIPLRLPPP